MKVSLEDHMKMGFLLKEAYQQALKQIKWDKKTSYSYKKKKEVINLILELKSLQNNILFHENPEVSDKHEKIYYGPKDYNKFEIKEKAHSLADFV